MVKTATRYYFFLLVTTLILLWTDLLGARYSNRGMELVKFMTLKNAYCTTHIFHEYNKYDEINKYLKLSFLVYPGFIQDKVGLTLKKEAFYEHDRELEIQVISDKTLNSRLIGQYGILLPVDGLYDPCTKTVYISKDFDLSTLVHEYFHYLRDISGIAMEHDREEELADQFADMIVDGVGAEQMMLSSQSGLRN
jgi:hypothetical protein